MTPSIAATATRTVWIFRPTIQFLARPVIRCPNKPEHGGKSQCTHLVEQLQVVVVRLVHKHVGVETAVLGVDDGKRAQPPAEYRFVPEYSQRVPVNAQARSAREFRAGIGSKAGHAVRQFRAPEPEEHPGHEHRGRRLAPLPPCGPYDA